MIKIPYKYLILAVVVLAGLTMLMPVVNGSTEDEKQEVSKKVFVIEKVGKTDDGESYFVNLNKKYYYENSSLKDGLTADQLTVGTWVEFISDEVDNKQVVSELKLKDSGSWVISGTIGSVLKSEDGEETIGFTINDRTILLDSHGHEGEEGEEHHIESGLGVKAEVELQKGSSFLRAKHIDVIRHHSLLHSMTLLMLQIAVILLFAKIFGEACERYLKQPAVLGELLGGIILSPYALGGMINIPGVGALFQTHNLSAIMKASPLQPDFAVSPELWAIAQIASIILLFMAGLETDLSRFLRYAGPATVIGLGGVITPFILGVGATVWLVPGFGWGDPGPLFMGAIMVATSVGITARVLSDINKLDTSEGVTILAGAVIDDVLGILVLAIVNGIALAELAGSSIDMGTIGMTALKAIGFWLGITLIGIITSKSVEKFILWFRSKGSKIAIGLSICFASAAAAELFGLAMIIGAYSIGLAMSDRDIAHGLEERLTGAYNFVVPIFFTVMGMMVDINAMIPLFWPYGVVISIFAVVSKIFGCGIPALFVGFNKQGAIRIGLGMLPRGEVALIIAGVGIANGIIATDMFGVAILITLVTTVLAPPLLVPAFQRGGPGVKGEKTKIPKLEQIEEPLIVVEALNEAHQILLKDMFLEAMDERGYQRMHSDTADGIYEIGKGDYVLVARLLRENGHYLISVDTVVGTREDVRNAFFHVMETITDYKEQLTDKLIKSDPQFLRKIKRVTSD